MCNCNRILKILAEDKNEKIKTVLFILCFALFQAQPIYAQLQDGSQPFSSKYTIQPARRSTAFPAMNADSLRSLYLENILPGQPPRFGVPVSVNFTITDAAFYPVKNGRLYIHKIKIPNAAFLMLNITDFQLKDGQKMWVYTPDKTFIRGAFTKFNTTNNRLFAVAPIPGDALVVEYFVPNNTTANAFTIKSALFGFTDAMFEKSGFGSSGSCNINVNCPIGQPWHKQRDAVVMMIDPNTGSGCSATVLNNTSKNGTPYILSAEHCIISPNQIFIFQYQSPGCQNINGPLQYTMQGCTLLSKSAITDFELVRLNNTPHPDYHAFYAGWDRQKTPLASATTIHHPRGDIKKISFEYEQVDSSAWLYYSSQPKVYWEITDWNAGTTEAGSSGSPLFNADKKVVGQLRGGFAKCGLDSADFYGMFCFSWDLQPYDSLSLAPWLDSSNTDSTEISGQYYFQPAFPLDVSLTAAWNIDALACSNTIHPELLVTNIGSDTAYLLAVEIKIDTAIYQQTFTVNMAFGDSAFLDWGAINYPISGDTVTVTINIVSINNQPDQYLYNNDLQIFIVPKPNQSTVKLNILTDQNPAETTVFVKDKKNKIAYFRNIFDAVTLHEDYVCLADDCYVVTIKDEGNDGICCTNGIGSFNIYISKSNKSYGINPAFGSIDSITFCSPVFDNDSKMFLLYPNPNNGNFTIRINPKSVGHTMELNIYGLAGKLIISNNLGVVEYNTTINIDAELSAGMYMVELIDLNTETTDAVKFIVLAQ